MWRVLCVVLERECAGYVGCRSGCWTLGGTFPTAAAITCIGEMRGNCRRGKVIKI